MIREILQDKEPVAYRSLYNALRNNKVAHSYLFSGELNPLKKDTALLLAASIINGDSDFIDEDSDLYKRVVNGQYYDVIYLDGYKSSIKKDDVERIMDEFSRTSLEKSGKKVYIISNINNSSPKVLNMILKFMEEPSSSNTFGIFITDHKEDLLETIISRCLDIPFMTRDFSFLIKEYMDKGFDYSDGYLLSYLLHKFDDEFDLNDDRYLLAKEYVYKTIENLENKKYIPIMFYRELYSAFTNSDDFKICADYYLSIFIKMIEDCIEHKRIEDEEYNHYLDMLSQYDTIKLLEIMEKAKDKILVNAERKLLFDQIAYEIISLI